MPERGPEKSLVDRRFAAVLEVAALHHTSVPIEEMAVLLPEGAPATAGELVRWIREDSRRGTVIDGVVSGSGWPTFEAAAVQSRRERGQTYWQHAQALLDGPLRSALPFLRCAGVTGSAAYREPVEGDDVDLMAVTRRGTTWLFLALAFVRLRWRSGGTAPAGSHWCLNYVVDEARAEREYLRPQGFLFAREALTARMIRGGQYYHDLLARAHWMQEELPRFYLKTLNQDAAPGVPSARLGLLTRLANAALFPLLAAYLQLVGLVRNHRLARAGRPDERFRTETNLDRFELRTAKFEGLREIYTSPVRSDARELPA